MPIVAALTVGMFSLAGCLPGTTDGQTDPTPTPAPTDAPTPTPVPTARCDSPGGEDDDLDFSGFGDTKVVKSTLGLGRHFPMTTNQDLVYEFDQPIPFCAVIPGNVTLTDLTTDTEIALAESQLSRVDLVDGSGTVVAHRLLIDLVDDLEAGNDYEVVLNAEELGLDGEFNQNAVVAKGQLPSGNGAEGGNFVQFFRAIEFDVFLTETDGAAGLALDAADQLYIVNETGLYGPFDAPAAVTEGSRLAPNLGSLAPRFIAIGDDGDVVVKEESSQSLFAVDPATGNRTEIVSGTGLGSSPRTTVVAPDAYSSIETANIGAGDLIIADDSGLSVPDVGDGVGQKAGLNLVDRASGNVNSAFLKLFVPQARDGKPREVYAAFRPEDDTGMEINRILPNGVVDRSAIPMPLEGINGVAALKLENILGREEFILIGLLDTTMIDTKQILPDNYDGRGIFIYNKAEHTFQVLTPDPIDTFAFNFSRFSDMAISSDSDEVYVSFLTLNLVLRATGFSNGANVDGTPACDSIFDEGLDFGNEGQAAITASTLGVGRHLLKSSPTVLEYESDLPLRYCNVIADNVTLAEADTGTAIDLPEGCVRRGPASALGGSRIVVDLPDTLAVGQSYEITLLGDGLGLGSDFVQTFQLIEGTRFLTDTLASVGVAVDGGGQVFASNEFQIFGPFASPSAVTSADEIGNPNRGGLAGGGRPIAADANGDVVYGSRAGEVFRIDVATDVETELATSAGGGFTLDAAIAPTGFDGLIAQSDDILLADAGSVFVPDLTSGSGRTTLATIADDLVSMHTLPISLFGPDVVGAIASFPNSVTIQSFAPDGGATDLVGPVTGIDPSSVVRLPDVGSADEWMIVGDFDPSDAPLLTKQIRETGTGLELIVHNPTGQVLQVIGIVSTAVPGSFGTPQPNFAAGDDLSAVYLSQPESNTVIQFTGLE
jgi:hypothetical protein